MSAPSAEIRLIIVEDVPQVTQYIRTLLSSQTAVKLLDVVTEGAKVVSQVEQLRPDVVIVDALLQGKVKGPAVVEQLHRLDETVPVIVLTVPQQPVDLSPETGVHAVLAMPFSGFEMFTKIQGVYSSFHSDGNETGGRIVAVFAPKGGVGKTTIAFNLAVALSQLKEPTVLIDGSLQFGDLRTLLKVPVDAPSILDLPTDRIQESDLRDVLWRDPSGIDILLAPPRIEMAEMVTVRDIDKALSLLRRVYRTIVVDMPSALSDVSLAFLDASDYILAVVTYDSTTIRNTSAIAETFRAIGYGPDKVQYLINRSDSPGGMSPEDLSRAIGRVPEHSVVSDGMLVIQSNNEGVPFVLANPNAPISRDVAKIAAAIAAFDRVAVVARR